MAQGARLKSIDAVEEMATAMRSFRDLASAALDDLEMELRRAEEWIGHDRKEYWAREVRAGWQRVSAAQVQLQQAKTSRRVGANDPSCIDEKKVLRRVQEQLEIAQEKVKTVAKWSEEIERAIREYRGCRTRLAGWLDSDFPRAQAALARIGESLEAYLRLAPPPPPPRAATVADASAPAASEPPAAAGPAPTAPPEALP
jgi:hypothetical protein